MGERTAAVEAHAAKVQPKATPEASMQPKASDDRRDSDRVPLTLMVRDLALGGSFEAHGGNLALGGACFEALHPPAGGRLELRFLLPNVRAEIRATAEVLRVTREGERFETHLRFVDIPLDAELAVARFLQASGRGATA